MRISYWSSDVCSSDLSPALAKTVHCCLLLISEALTVALYRVSLKPFAPPIDRDNRPTPVPFHAAEQQSVSGRRLHPTPHRIRARGVFRSFPCPIPAFHV